LGWALWRHLFYFSEYLIFNIYASFYFLITIRKYYIFIGNWIGGLEWLKQFVAGRGEGNGPDPVAACYSGET
jgi:hypothetical protein